MAHGLSSVSGFTLSFWMATVFLVVATALSVLVPSIGRSGAAGRRAADDARSQRVAV